MEYIKKNVNVNEQTSSPESGGQGVQKTDEEILVEGQLELQNSIHNVAQAIHTLITIQKWMQSQLVNNPNLKSS